MAQGVLIFRPGGSGHADGGHADGVPVASRGRASGMASELRRAFRKRALESHPDKHPPRSQDVGDTGNAARQLGVQVLAVGIDYP